MLDEQRSCDCADVGGLILGLLIGWNIVVTLLVLWLIHAR